MKKILFILTALICMAMTAQSQTVYVSTGSDAVAYHKNKSCSYLKNSKDIKSVSTAEAKKMGRHECQRCYGTAAATTKKATTKKTTTTAKKETTAAKKTTPARDEKGRFVKKADTEKTTTTKKTTPARDEKGRFIKTTDQKSTKSADKKSTKKSTEKKATKTTEKKVKKAA
jgi:hypothetical protein